MLHACMWLQLLLYDYHDLYYQYSVVADGLITLCYTLRCSDFPVIPYLSEGAVVSHSYTRINEVQSVLSCMKERLPQLELDGTRNVWIVKPGAKSRGRGKSLGGKIDRTCWQQ